MMGPLARSLRRMWGGTVDFVLSDQSCSYARGQIHVKLTDRDIEKLARNDEWPADLVQDAHLVPSYRTFGVPVIVVLAILGGVGLFAYKIYQEAMPKKHARSEIPNDIVIKYITGLVRACAVDGQIKDVEIQHIRDYVARDLGRNVNTIMVRKLAQDMRHERFEPLSTFDGLPQNIAEDLFFGIRYIVSSDGEVTEEERTFLSKLEQVFTTKYGVLVRHS